MTITQEMLMPIQVQVLIGIIVFYLKSYQYEVALDNYYEIHMVYLYDVKIIHYFPHRFKFSKLIK